MTEAEELDREGSKLTDRASRMAGQMGNWTMAANAGGVAFVLTTARDLEAGTTISLATAYAAFLAGLVSGFVGHLFLMSALSQAAMATAVASGKAEVRAKLRESAKGEGGIVAEMGLDDLKAPVPVELGKPLKWFAGLGIAAYVVAAICAISGLSYPLVNGLLK